MARLVKVGLLITTLSLTLWLGVHHAISSPSAPDTAIDGALQVQPPIVLHLVLAVEQSAEMYNNDSNGQRFDAVQTTLEYLWQFQQHILGNQGRILVSVMYYGDHTHFVDLTYTPPPTLLTPQLSLGSPLPPGIWLDLYQYQYSPEMMDYYQPRLTDAACQPDVQCWVFKTDRNIHAVGALEVAAQALDAAHRPAGINLHPNHQTGLILLSTGASRPYPNVPPALSGMQAYIMLLNATYQTTPLWSTLTRHWPNAPLVPLDNAADFPGTTLSMSTTLLQNIPTSSMLMWDHVQEQNQPAWRCSNTNGFGGYQFEVLEFTTNLQIVSGYERVRNNDGLCIYPATANGFAATCAQPNGATIRQIGNAYSALEVWTFAHPESGIWCVETTHPNGPNGHFGPDTIGIRSERVRFSITAPQNGIQYSKQTVTVHVDPPDYPLQARGIALYVQNQTTGVVTNLIPQDPPGSGNYSADVYLAGGEQQTLVLGATSTEGTTSSPLALPTTSTAAMPVTPVELFYECLPDHRTDCLLPGTGVEVQIETRIGGSKQCNSAHDIDWRVLRLDASGRQVGELLDPICDASKSLYVTSFTYDGGIGAAPDEYTFEVSGEASGGAAPLQPTLVTPNGCTYRAEPAVPFSSGSPQAVKTADSPTFTVQLDAPANSSCPYQTWLQTVGPNLVLHWWVADENGIVLGSAQTTTFDPVNGHFVIDLGQVLNFSSPQNGLHLYFEVTLNDIPIFENRGRQIFRTQ